MNHPDKNEFMNRVKSGWEEGISVAARCLPQVFNNYKRRGESEGEKPVQCPPSSSFQVNVRKRHFLGLQEQAAVAHWAEDPVLVAAQDPGPECTTLALQYPG